jgi:hypothetical protein
MAMHMSIQNLKQIQAVSLFLGTRISLKNLGFMVSVILLLCAYTPQAHAQADICGKGQKLFSERQTLIARINSWKTKRVDPDQACSVFGRLQNNGTQTIKWVEENKDWCQIPAQILESLQSQQGAIAKNRGQACQAAAQYNKAKKEAYAKARQQQQQQQQQGGGGAFGGADHVTGGAMRVPQGAL